MKKFLTALFVSVFSFASANAELISVGVSGNIGMLSADGTETITGTSQRDVVWGENSAGNRASGTSSTSNNKGSEDLMIGYLSVFSEVHIFDSGIRVGASYVPYAMDSQTTENVRNDGCSGGAEIESTTCTTSTNKVDVTLEELVSVYLAFHKDVDSRFISSAFIKAGMMQAKLNTNEVLASGSSYGNTDLKGEFFGLGLEKKIADQGVFVRIEGHVTTFNNITLTNKNTDAHENTNTIEVKGLDGATALLSIGKSF